MVGTTKAQGGLDHRQTRRILRNACEAAAPKVMSRVLVESLEPRTLLTAVCPVGTESLVSPAHNDAWAPTVAMDQDGDYVAIWLSASESLDQQTSILAQRFSADGQRQGEILNIASTSTFEPGTVRVAMDAVGDFVVAWSQSRSGQDASNIYARRYNASGLPQGAAIHVNQSALHCGSSPAVAMDDAGDFVVGWADSGFGYGDVRARSYGADGLPKGNEFLVGQAEGPISLSMDSAGDCAFAWTWSTASPTGYGINFGLTARRYRADGSLMGPDVQFTSSRPNSGILAPQIAMNNSGAFAVTWFSGDGWMPTDYYYNSWDIFARVYDSAGAPVGAELAVNTFTTGNQTNPSIAMDNAGGFLIAWTSGVQDGNEDGVYARRFDAAGDPAGEEQRVNTYTIGRQQNPAIAMDADGDAVIAWQSYGQANVNRSVYAQRFEATNDPAIVRGRIWDDANGNGLQDEGETSRDGIQMALYTPAGLPVASAMSDADGRYSFQVLPGQSYYLQVTRPEGTCIPAPHNGTDDLIDSDLNAADGRSDLFVPVSGNETVFDIGLAAAATITGAVYVDADADGVRDGGEVGSGSWIIFCDEDNDGALDPTEPSTTSNQDGTYVLCGLRPGTQTITQLPRSGWVAPVPQSMNVPLGQTISAVDFGSRLLVSTTDFAPSGDAIIVNPDAGSWDATWGNLVVAADADGNFVVAWEQFVTGSGRDVFARLYHADGTASGPAFRVNTTTKGDQERPAVAMDANGEFVIAWVDQTGVYYGNEIYAQRYDSKGQPQGGEFRVNTATNVPELCVSVAMDADGDFVAVWDADDHPGDEFEGVYGRRFDANGVPQGDEFHVNTFTRSDQGGSHVAMDAEGNFAVTWSNWDAGDSRYEVYARLYSAAGTPITGEFAVGSGPSGVQRADALADGIAMQPNGDFAIVWTTEYPMGQCTTYAQRFNAAGQVQGAAIPVGSTPGSARDSVACSMAMDADGELVVTAYQRYNKGTITTRRFNAAGLPAGEAKVVGVGTAAATAMDPRGNCIIAWQDTENAINAQIYRPSSYPDAVVTGSSEADSFYLIRSGNQVKLYKGLKPSGTPLATYSLASLNTLTINGLSGNDALVVDLANGDPIPAGGLFMNGGGNRDVLAFTGTDDQDDLAITPGRVLFGSSLVSANGIEALTLNPKSGEPIALNSLAIDGRARVRLASGGAVLSTNALSIRNGGSLDLMDGDLVIHASAETRQQTLADLTRWLKSGEAKPWRGITTSATGANRNVGLGIALNDAGNGT
ncbi:MAG: SdrD B-like domain-containing protein, partial [Bacillota bacterium]